MLIVIKCHWTADIDILLNPNAFSDNCIKKGDRSIEGQRIIWEYQKKNFLETVVILIACIFEFIYQELMLMGNKICNNIWL